jgi:hypothetical protein
MPQKSLTIVLPVHNVEAKLASCLHQILDLASELTPQFSILVVDDGSTDDTLAVARELAARFPQIAVRRHHQQHGLGTIINMARRRITSDVVIVHDGVTPIDANEVRTLWRRSAQGANGPFVTTSHDVSDLACVRSTHDAMATAHGRVLGFHLLQPAVEKTTQAAPSTTTLPSEPRPSDRVGVGQIPPLPRPNFLSAVAEFALGE